MTEAAARIIDLYQRHAENWDRDRPRHLFERPWLDRLLALLPPGGSILDLGCGSGEPIARYFIEAGCVLTGVDSSPAMIAFCRGRFPAANWCVADMRALSLDRRFDGIVAWDSFFHLTADDQRSMFDVFRKHAAAGAGLMLTSGPRSGIAMGEYCGEPLYHASLDPAEYRRLFGEHGFDVVSFMAEDPACGGHTIWLARRNQ